MAKKRKKYPKLPNSFGTIRYLGGNRRNPFAVHPPAVLDEKTGKPVRPPAICYVDDWIKGFTVLTAYKAGTYQPGMERNLEISPTTDVDTLVTRLIADYNTIKGVEDKHPEIKKLTFSEVYKKFYAWKFPEGSKLSYSSKIAYQTAYSNCTALYNRIFEDLKAPDLQKVIDDCPLKRQSLMAILTLFKQMYKYAVYSEIVTENKALYVKVNVDDDTEHGTPFSDNELKILWKNSADPEVQLILIMCYSGWRIGEVLKLTTNLEERYFQGGIKTKAGKDRVVPIHSAVYEFAKQRFLLKAGSSVYILSSTTVMPCSILRLNVLELLAIRNTRHTTAAILFPCYVKNTASGRTTGSECWVTLLVEMLQTRYMDTGHWKNSAQRLKR